MLQLLRLPQLAILKLFLFFLHKEFLRSFQKILHWEFLITVGNPVDFLLRYKQTTLETLVSVHFLNQFDVSSTEISF